MRVSGRFDITCLVQEDPSDGKGYFVVETSQIQVARDRADHPHSSGLPPTLSRYITEASACRLPSARFSASISVTSFQTPGKSSQYPNGLRPSDGPVTMKRRRQPQARLDGGEGRSCVVVEYRRSSLYGCSGRGVARPSTAFPADRLWFVRGSEVPKPPLVARPDLKTHACAQGDVVISSSDTPQHPIQRFCLFPDALPDCTQRATCQVAPTATLF